MAETSPAVIAVSQNIILYQVLSGKNSRAARGALECCLRKDCESDAGN